MNKLASEIDKLKRELEEHKIIPNPNKDQFFLVDKNIIKKIISFADLDKNDVVLEIGAGIGNLTQEIAKKTSRVIAFEIDERFKPFLQKLPKNVEVHFENAWKFVQLKGKFKKKKAYNKVVSNLPYSFIEPFLHNLTFLEYDKVILLIPVRFLKKIDGWGVFGSFFKTEIKMFVDKSRFYPTPKTNSVIIDLVKLPDPIKTKNPGLFLRQYIYQHEKQKIKNSLMEGVIKYAKLAHNKNLTKNQARKIISESWIKEGLLDSYPSKPEVYDEVSKRFRKLNLRLG
jgi:16S rRNA (adenine1518-N6/adenine1519-N6)-dimethyltransferase